MAEPVDLDRLDALFAAATDGEWVATYFTKPTGDPIETLDDLIETQTFTAMQSTATVLFGIAFEKVDGDGFAPVIAYTGNGPTSEANCVYAATLHNAYPALAAELRTLRAREEAYANENDRLVDVIRAGLGRRAFHGVAHGIDELIKDLSARRARVAELERKGGE